MSEITYDDKVDLQVATNIANINKVTASDMNEIKNVVNGNADEVGNLTSLTTTDKTSVVNAVNELNAPEKWVSVGATAPTDGRRVWFKKGKNLYNNDLISTRLFKMSTSVTYENEQIVMRTTGADAYFGNIVSVGNSWSEKYGQLISVEPNTNYTLSITNNVVDKNFITYYDENKVSIKIDYNQPYQVTFTTPNNAKYVSFRFGNENSTSDGVYKFNIQLEKGSTATTYEPYVNPSINVDEEQWYVRNGWTNRTNELTFNNSNANNSRTLLFVNETLRLVYLQVWYNSSIASTTIAKPLQYPLKYKPASVETDKLWFSMSPDIGGLYTARGSIQYNDTETYINIICASNTINNPYGSIIYPY